MTSATTWRTLGKEEHMGCPQLAARITTIRGMEIHSI